ncbi:MAG: GlsB/YeaQ/YmgE family stress response membrane protein [Chthoniobacteraceae bacterium]
MHLIGAIIIGLIIGAIAKFLTPGKDPGGCIITILLGLAGSFVGTYIGQALGLYQVGEPAGFIGSVIGAVILLLVYRMIFNRSGRAS